VDAFDCTLQRVKNKSQGRIEAKIHISWELAENSARRKFSGAPPAALLRNIAMMKGNTLQRIRKLIAEQWDIAKFWSLMGFVAEIVLMIIDLISLFSEMLDGFLGSSIISRARKQELLSYRPHNLRQWSEDRHGRVDDRPFGAVAGMVLRPGPIVRAIANLRKEQSYVTYLCPDGVPLKTSVARELAQKQHLVFSPIITRGSIKVSATAVSTWNCRSVLYFNEWYLSGRGRDRRDLPLHSGCIGQ
jgi:hypothetical protein